MQAENIALDEKQVVLKKYITQVNSERISILAKLKEFSCESIDAKRTVTEELQSSLLALQMDRDSLLSQICATEAEIQALRNRFETLEAHALSVGISTFSDRDHSRLDLLEFEINDSTGAFKKLEHELAGLSNKLESGGGVDFHGFTFAYDDELVQWFNDRNGKISIFADAVAILNAIGDTLVTTQEATRAQEAA
jgi:predicted RNase H-like nuclease (RuvC/YqgF family)